MAKAKAPAIKKVGEGRRDPTPEEAEAIALAREAQAKRPARVRPPAIEAIFQGPGALAIQSPHSDATGWGTQMMEALGVDSYAVIERLMMGASQIGKREVVNNQDDADAAQRLNNYALSFVAAFRPASAIEATLCLQMLATHEAGMKMSGLLHSAGNRDAVADYTRLMNQTMRTFAAQAEALTKLRTGGKQQVEVRYVYFDARTQTVVNQGGGAGGIPFNPQQPHGPGFGAVGYAPAPGLPLRSEDASGDGLPVASDQREAALPDAWGS